MSTPKVVGLMSCGFLLCLSLSNAAQAGNAPSASDVMKTDSQSDRTGFQEDTIKGEVLRIEGENYFVKGQDGKEVRLHTDKTTQRTANISQGDRIEAKVNNQNHALSMRLAQGTDAAHGNEGGRDSLHETDADHKTEPTRATDSTLESGKSGSMGP